MVFQPTSPIRHFQLIAPRARPSKDSDPQHPTTTVVKRLSAALDKIYLNKGSSSQHRITSAPEFDSAMNSESSHVAESRSISETISLKLQSTHLPQSPTITELSVNRSSTEIHSGRETTNSSPTDPAYVPSELKIRTVSVELAKSPRSTLGKTVARNKQTTQSFFDSDTGSEEDEPVVGRASSVRMSKPMIVAGRSGVQGQRAHPYGVTLDVCDRPASPSVSQVSDIAESTTTTDATTVEQKTGGPAEALAMLEGRTFDRTSARVPTSGTIRSPASMFSGSVDTPRSGGLFMNPVTDGDRTSIQRAISAPPLPQRHPSHKKVRIRPSDLIIVHSDDSVKHFREKIVTTPYPVITEEDKSNEYEAEQDEKLTALGPRSSMMKSARTDNDRFPSPARSETLFLSLGLANHPSAITSLEIEIANKDIYDDEMLFRQIRTAYRSQLLGMSRFLFCFIRSVTHATTSTSVQHDFKTSDFMKHFNDPRIGRKRKTWIIWLRHHSRQQTPITGDALSMTHRPVSASLRTADKRLSGQSDSSSTLNISFLPPLAIPRIPFFSKGSTVSATASARRPYSTFGSENGSGLIQIDLHHEFSFWLLAFLYGCVVLMSIAAVVLWTIFGLPGTRPGGNVLGSPAPTMVDRLAWTSAAQTRVLTALVLGMMVALLGSMMEICLIAGAYILL